MSVSNVQNLECLSILPTNWLIKFVNVIIVSNLCGFVFENILHAFFKWNLFVIVIAKLYHFATKIVWSNYQLFQWIQYILRPLIVFLSITKKNLVSISEWWIKKMGVERGYKLWTQSASVLLPTIKRYLQNCWWRCWQKQNSQKHQFLFYHFKL